MKIIVISGAWCTGKTGVAKKLSELLDWQIFSLDHYKEKRFDQDERGSLIQESYDDLFENLKEALNEDQSCIVESDFIDDQQVQRLIKISQHNRADLIQIYLHAEPKVLAERFIQRLESGERHSGHGDEQYLEKAKQSLKSNDYSGEASFSPLELPGSVIKIETSDFDKIDYNSIIETMGS
ncbi:AAA family ATPase [Candidatus Uhrbacteria bacterium]|jgi:predicted kinase|nr:AAA family ATPase [Candidatus Uhrbacteria bacterium]MBT7717445.1 AAA family ATPase [Candidatus Uhrbacteria bacterium]